MVHLYLSFNKRHVYGPALGEPSALYAGYVLETLLKNDDLKLADVEISISKGS